MQGRRDYILGRIRDVASANLSTGARVILYGSRARGDADGDSDWDLLVVLDKQSVGQSDYDSVAYALTSLGWEEDEDIRPVLYTKAEWRSNAFTPFYKNVEAEGISLI